MSDCGMVPDELRGEIKSLVVRGETARAIAQLTNWTNQHTRTPWAMERLGELHLEAKNRIEAGRAFFWSGMRGDEEQQSCINEFLQSTKRDPIRIMRTLPRTARTELSTMPPTLRGELAGLGVTDATVERANRKSSFVGGVIGLALGGVIFLVGLVTTFRWLVQIVRYLLAA